MTGPRPKYVQKCMRCGVPDGEQVVRRKFDMTKWALDTDLAEEFPDTWTKPRKAVVLGEHGYGLCTICRVR